MATIFVSYVAGRNIVTGASPYMGGTVSGWMTEGYGPHVQGIGETPAWALYLGLSYFLSGGQVFTFNFLSKLPIIGANVALGYFAYSRGARGWRFYFLNMFLILTSATWGQPDNLATYLAMLALISSDSAITSALLLSSSLMIKPLAVAILPAYFGGLGLKSRFWMIQFILGTIMMSSVLFLCPFFVLGWPLETVISGIFNWFSPVGGLSVFNAVQIVYGTTILPTSISWVAYLLPLSILLLTAFAVRRPDGCRPPCVVVVLRFLHVASLDI